MKYLRLAIGFCLILTLNNCFLKDEVLPACEANNTSEVYFANNSTTGKTYDIVWDGVKMTTISPGQESSKFTVTAGIVHTLSFRVAGTSTLACSDSTPSIPKCQTKRYSCSG